jgi:hypothetical protein
MGMKIRPKGIKHSVAAVGAYRVAVSLIYEKKGVAEALMDWQRSEQRSLKRG